MVKWEFNGIHSFVVLALLLGGGMVHRNLNKSLMDSVFHSLLGS